MSERIIVRARGAKYPIVFSSLENWAEPLEPVLESASRIIVIVDVTVKALYGRLIQRGLRRFKSKTIMLAVPSGEKIKSLKYAGSLVERALAGGIDRQSLIVAIGGGVTTDLAGFVASLALRGIKWCAAPTTLLGMVDAAIGGKTGVNSPRGKNLIGSFWPPETVSVAPAFCLTQSGAGIRDGLAECLKYYAIGGKPSLSAIAGLASAAPDFDLRTLTGVIRSCARAKARIVSSDERETGARAFLNFGHTIGHSLELAAKFRGLSHGRAVAAGMVGSLWISRQQGLPESATLDKLEKVSRSLAAGPVRKMDEAEIVRLMGLDKKRKDGKLRFVLLRSIGQPYLAFAPEAKILRRAVLESLNALRA